MKTLIANLINQALGKLAETQSLPNPLPEIQVDYTKDSAHGDFACNIALLLAKPMACNPRQLAEQLVTALPAHSAIAKVDIAGPGFINFTLSAEQLLATIPTILAAQTNYGRNNLGAGKRVHMEYVSANPTGPLHVGHGRGAAYGATVADLLTAVGYQVHKEYYVNDAGRQMQILALSIWLRYQELLGEAIQLPENAYQGEYIIDIARQLQAEHGESYKLSMDSILAELKPLDPSDKETYIDAMITNAKLKLGEDRFQLVLNLGLKSILADIRDDLAEFGVSYDQWFPESELFVDGSFEQGIELLKSHGHTYTQNGALWFKATDFGDEKDRVLIRENGQPTYFASDVAYHLHKYNAGFDHIVDIFGADHHGYLPRIRAFLQGLGKEINKLSILLVQFAILYRGKEKVSMSTRAGSFVTLRELRNEVGNDAARFFYIMRKAEQHLDFDLELAKSKSNENPVYYIQYAHARICSIWRQLKQRNLNFDQAMGLSKLSRLTSSHEKSLLINLMRFPEVIAAAAHNYEPHIVAHYLQNLANIFHSYYNAEQFILDDTELSNARMCLITAVQIVLANGLKLLGVSAPNEM